MIQNLHQNLFLLVTNAVASRDERAASLVEYALLIALIAVVCIGAVSLLGGSVGDSFSGATSRLAGSSA